MHDGHQLGSPSQFLAWFTQTHGRRRCEPRIVGAKKYSHFLFYFRNSQNLLLVFVVPFTVEQITAPPLLTATSTLRRPELSGTNTWVPEDEELMTINIDSSKQSRARLQLQPTPRYVGSTLLDL